MFPEACPQAGEMTVASGIGVSSGTGQLAVDVPSVGRNCILHAAVITWGASQAELHPVGPQVWPQLQKARK